MAVVVDVIRSFAELLQLLHRDGVPHEPDLAKKTLRIPTQRGTLDGVLLIRWQDDDAVVQFIQPLPMTVPADRLPALAEAVSRLNHALAVPGFDLNHAQGLVAYRLYLPLYPRGEISSEEVQAMFRMTVKTAADFLPLLAAVASGNLAPARIVEQAESAAEAPSPPPAASHAAD